MISTFQTKDGTPVTIGFMPENIEHVAKRGLADVYIAATEDGFSPLGSSRRFLENDLAIPYEEIKALADWNRFENDQVSIIAIPSRRDGSLLKGLILAPCENSKCKAMVECVRPRPNKSIADPACGNGGFFLAAYDFLVTTHQLDKSQKTFLKHETFFGNEIVPGTRRLCLMNMFLHNIGEIDGNSLVSPNDALVADDGKRFDYVLANPPFGKKSAMSFTNDDGEQARDDLTYNRQDFWATTSNKQLNFVMHIRNMLKTTGMAAVVVPDNVLFEGGAGETVRRKLLETTELHTILRLPTGIFYANGVKANVLFFDNHVASKDAWTKEVWYYDYRTNIHHTLKKKPLRFEDLGDFITCYNPQNRHMRNELWNEQTNPEGRRRKFSYEQISARDKTSLDIFWLKDKSLADLDNLPEPDELALDIIENLEAGLASFREVATALS